MASIVPGLRRAVPRMSRNLFVCHQCAKYSRRSNQHIGFRLPVKANKSSPIRFNSSAATLSESVGSLKDTSPLKSLSKNISHAERERASKTKNGFFPETSSNTVAYWLLGSAASVFGIVVFGGLTRLTESGFVSPRNQVFDSDKNPASASPNGSP